MEARRKKGTRVKIVRVPGRSKKGKGAKMRVDPRISAYLRLLADPCAANLAHPPYAGTDAGYLIRTVETMTPTATGTGYVVGNTYTGEFMLSITPSGYVNYGGMFGQAIAASTPMSIGNYVYGGAFLAPTNNIVRRFRPVAACLKWVPNGPYSTRRGTVGSMYSAGTPFTVTDSLSTGQLLTECTRIVPNGSEMHEVRFLPTSVDENFTTAVSAANGGGTMTFVLTGVDCTATSTTVLQANGGFEITIVWEWTPAGSTGVSVNPQAPLPYTTQQVLSTIGDMGAFLFQGALKAGQGAIKAATAGVIQGLTSGVQAMSVRGAAIPRVAYRV